MSLLSNSFRLQLSNNNELGRLNAATSTNASIFSFDFGTMIAVTVVAIDAFSFSSCNCATVSISSSCSSTFKFSSGKLWSILSWYNGIFDGSEQIDNWLLRRTKWPWVSHWWYSSKYWIGIYLNLASTDGVDVWFSRVLRLRFGLDASILSATIKSSVCTPRESMLGVRDTVDDCLAPLRNIFDMSEFVELLEIDTNRVCNVGERKPLNASHLRLLLNFVCCSKLSTCFWRANTCRLAVSDRLFLSRFEQCSLPPSIDDLWKYGPVSSNDAPWRFASNACKCVRPDVLARWRGIFPFAVDERWCVCVRCVGDIGFCWPIDERWHAVKFGTEPLRETRRSFGDCRGELREKNKLVNKRLNGVSIHDSPKHFREMNQCSGLSTSGLHTITWWRSEHTQLIVPTTRLRSNGMCRWHCRCCRISKIKSKSK